ncbi:DUF1499 domain-containing protein [Celeribacter indicus]|uniref:DUF1499 domain-containing protein n=1 Tax=Celeribacter indicus TaxID=1208324 RepID=A0A0B5DVE5_9RHOB|nr:DUF1499 domain-containing protein [Celeribacter indicus]AJE47383.1 hypothetical protein P73_2668 [Celeribacter indicus]SDW05126.1 Protein of unknown function [Celeribacter indicus]
MALWILLGLFLVLQAVIRLAPTDPARWHVDPFAAADPGRRGAKRLLAVPHPPAEALAQIDAVAATWPRTRHIAGSAGEGRMSYVTRSGFWGLPDYTTVAVRPHEAGAELALLARQRFGRGDFGTNAARLRDWIAAAGV